MMMKATGNNLMSRQSPPAMPKATRVTPKLWCKACARLRWMVTLEEANQLVYGHPCRSHKTDAESDKQMVTEGHQLELACGAQLVCLHALFPKAFDFDC
jgi:hypothetical protein